MLLREEVFGKEDAPLSESGAETNNERCGDDLNTLCLDEIMKRDDIRAAKARGDDRAMFLTVRHLKAYARNFDAVRVMDLMDTWLTYHAAKWSNYFPGGDDDELRLRFRNMWNAVRFAIGENTLTVAAKLAASMPLQFDRADAPGPLEQKFFTLCEYLNDLQQLDGKNFIILGCRAIAKVLGCKSPTTVSSLRAWAMSRGRLKESKAADLAKRHATEFTYFSPLKGDITGHM